MSGLVLLVIIMANLVILFTANSIRSSSIDSGSINEYAAITMELESISTRLRRLINTDMTHDEVDVLTNKINNIRARIRRIYDLDKLKRY